MTHPAWSVIPKLPIPNFQFPRSTLSRQPITLGVGSWILGVGLQFPTPKVIGREGLPRSWTLGGALLLVVSTAAAQDASRRPAVPVEPIAAIVDAFQTHQVVALPDAHGNEQAHAFVLSLVRDPRFAATVNDIVVEFGSARYQDVIDRFVGGEDVPYESLRMVWQNITMGHGAADYPTSEAFFRAVRAVNASLPRERRLRVLLGDPPIDWDHVRTREDHFKWLAMRDSYPAALIQTEVIAKERKALLLYGSLHFQRRQVVANYDMDDWRAQTIVSILERNTPAKVFTIWGADDRVPVLSEVSSWRAPSLALVRGTTLGAADFAVFSSFNSTATRLTLRDGHLVPIPREQWRVLPAEQQFDAVLYLGPSSAMKQSQIPPALCRDKRYVEMRMQRIAIAGPKVEADKLTQYCAAVAPK
jgi:hypothetical protein